MVGSHAVRVLNPHDAALDALDLVAPVAELKYVAGKAFDGEILVYCSDEVVFRLEQHLIVGVVGDGTACRQRGQSRAAAPAQDPIDGVMVDQRTAPATPRAEAIRQACRRPDKKSSRERSRYGHARWISANSSSSLHSRAATSATICCASTSSGRSGIVETIELAAADAVEQCRALHQLVARQRKQATLRACLRPRDRNVLPAAGSWRSNAASRADTQDRHRRCRCPSSSDAVATKRLQVAVLQPLLGIEPLILGKAAVVCGDIRLAEQLGKLPRHPLCHPTRVYEYERRPVLFDQSRQAAVDLLPHLCRHDRFERGIRNLQSEFAVATMSGIHDGAVRTLARQWQRRRPEIARRLRIGFCVAESPIRSGGLCRKSTPGVRARAPDGCPRLFGAIA